jgi:hypothetical protein
MDARRTRREANLRRVQSESDHRKQRAVEAMVSGRRVYPRFRQVAPATGLIRISRDVAVDAAVGGTAISVLSDVPGVIGEELTLALVSSAGETELRVRVADSRPQFVDGVMRHQMRLELIAADS